MLLKLKKIQNQCKGQSGADIIVFFVITMLDDGGLGILPKIKNNTKIKNHSKMLKMLLEIKKLKMS